MEFKNEYARFNDFYYDRLNVELESAKNGNQSSKEMFDDFSKFGVDIDSPLIYKKVIDDEQEVTIDSKKYVLLPMGLINKKIPLL